MQKESLINIKYSSEKIIHTSLFIYLFLLIFPHTTTLKEISFWIAAICWVLLRLRKSEPFITLNPIIASLSLFMVIAFISSVIGMEPLENLKRFKGELLVPFILFLITATEFNSIEKAKRLLFAPVIAFAIYTLLAVFESTDYGLQYFWDKTNREQYVWLTSYSQFSAFAFPLILGLILFITNRWLRYFLIAFAVIVFAMLTAYRGFTVFLGAVSILLLWMMFAKPPKYRLWMIAFVALFIFIFGFLSYTYKNHQAVTEYMAKFERIINISDELKSEEGFSNRIPAWIAAIDIIKDRPILGYGWGIKKFKELVYQEKFLERWKENKPSVYEFYTVTVKNTFFPPHNLFLEIAVQSGLLGFTAFIVFIAIYSYYLIKNILRTSSDEDRNFSMILIGGTFLSFIIVNLMSNDMGNDAGKIFFVVIGIGAGWIKNKELQHSTHYSIG
mgnify:FL=1